MSTQEYLRALTSKGQVTVPKAIRDRLGLGPGALVRFRMDARGTVTISRATPSLDEGYGAVAPLSRPEDFRRRRDEVADQRVEANLGGGEG